MSRALKDHVYFTSLEVENVKAFGGRQKLDLTCPDGKPARWTLILGDNGSGKTTLLQCLTRMRPIFDDRTEEKRESPFTPEIAREEDNVVFDELMRTGANVVATLEADLVAGYNLDGRGGRPNRLRTWARIERRGGAFFNWECGGERARTCPEPLVLAYGAGRHIHSPKSDRTSAGNVESLFDAAAELRDAKTLLYQLDYAVAKRRPGVARRLQALKRMLATVLPDVSGPNAIEINPPDIPGGLPGRAGIHISVPTGTVPLDQLSLGYQTVTAWTIDIAWRLFEHYPDSPNPLLEPAVVVVDEIDLHLHPRWQRELRGDLATHFPNIQFIATAHSPLMAQVYLDANLAVLRIPEGEDQVQIVNEPHVVRDWRLDQVLTSELFGLQSFRPPRTSENVRRRVELLQKEALTPEEEEELTRLESMMSSLGPEWSEDDEVAMEIVRQAAARLKANEEKLDQGR